MPPRRAFTTIESRPYARPEITGRYDRGVIRPRLIRLDSATPASSWHTPPFAGARVLHGDTLGRANLFDGQSTRQFDSPTDALHWLEHDAGPRRWVGFIAYEFAAFLGEMSFRKPLDAGLPLFCFVETSDVPPREPPTNTGNDRIASRTFSRNEYHSAVERVLAYIAAGDTYQINLSQRFSIPTSRTARDIYAHLLARRPAAFGGLLEFDDFAVLSNSPELFLRIDRAKRTIVNRPIKGTRPNAPGMHAELLASEKDAAELAMIVDLQRNDLGRVCELGSVRVTNAREIETHPTVLHGVATIEGQLRKNVSLVDILRATFPCGSITGCPKIRAMQIIDELEPVARGVYCGAVGFIDPHEIQLNVAIRTMLLRDGVAHICAGGGVVADSTAAGEYDETIVKAAALLEAIGFDGDLDSISPGKCG